MEAATRILAVYNGLPHEDIRAQLQRILSHEEFQATDKMRDFLRFVVEETLAGREHQLKGYTIATQVFGRDDDFDAAQDPVVRIQASRLRRAIERYYLVAGGHDHINIDIPKGTYIPVFTLASQPNANQASNWAPMIEKDRIASWPTVLVRPFQNMTGNSELAYLGEGLSTELCIELDRYQDIRVLMFREGDKSKDVSTRFAIDGSVRKDDKHLKVVVQLIDTTTGEQIWVDAFKSEFELAAMIDFQENAANRIAAQIAGHHGIIVKTMSKESNGQPIHDLTTYQAVLKTYAYDQAMTPESYSQAFEALKTAIDNDPECGMTRGMLAFLYADNIALEFFDLEQTPLDEAVRLAQQSVLMDSNNQVNRLALSRLRMLNNELDTALAETEAALALNPNSLFFMDVIGYYLVLLGEWERGVALINKAIHMNPFYRVYVHFATWLNWFRKKEYQRAYQELDFTLGTGNFWDPLTRAATLGQLGKIEEGRKAVDELLLFKPDFSTRARKLIGHSIKFDEITAEFIEGLNKVGLNVD